MNPDLLAAQKRYHRLRALMWVLGLGALVAFSAVLMWVSVATLELVEDVERFTECGSIPAQQSVELHRQNAQRLNALLDEHDREPVALPAPRPNPCSFKEMP